MDKSVSVIIPAYNHGKYVSEALQSAFSQTFSNLEVLVVNDGSTDDTAEILRPLVEAGKIRYFAQENRGQAAARNRGLSEARGEFIAFLDDDDRWPPDKLAWQVAHLNENPGLAAVAGTAEVVDETGRPLRRTSCVGKITFENLFEASQMLSPGQCLFRSRCLNAVGGFDPAMGDADDWDLYFRLARSWQFDMLDRISLYYRKHQGNASRNPSRMLRSSVAVVERNMAHAPRRQQNKLRDHAYRFVYQYAGTKLLAEVRNDLANGRVSSAIKNLAGMRTLFPAMVRNPRLFFYATRDLLPAGLRGILRRPEFGAQ